MIEFRKEYETGRYFILEINPKFWGSLELAYRAGVDFPKYLVEFFLYGRKPQKYAIKIIYFTWLSSAFSSYSKYKFKTLMSIIARVRCKNLFMSDLHLTDPPNLAQKSAKISSSFFKSMFVKETPQHLYITDELIECLAKLDGIISDFDETLVSLKVPWKRVIRELKLQKLISGDISIMEAFYNYRLNNDKESFHRLNEIVKEYQMNAIKNLSFNKQLERNTMLD